MTPVQARSVNVVTLGDAHAASLENRAVGGCADEPDGPRQARSGPSIPASPLVATTSQQSRGRPSRPSCAIDRIGGSRRIGDQDHAAALAAPLAQSRRPRPGRARRRRERRPRYRTGSAGISGRARPMSSFDARGSASACSIGATSSGLLSSRSANGGVSTSTTATGTPASRNRSCSSPSSISSSLDRCRAHKAPALRGR